MRGVWTSCDFLRRNLRSWRFAEESESICGVSMFILPMLIVSTVWLDQSLIRGQCIRPEDVDAESVSLS